MVQNTMNGRGAFDILQVLGADDRSSSPPRASHRDDREKRDEPDEEPAKK